MAIEPGANSATAGGATKKVAHINKGSSAKTPSASLAGKTFNGVMAKANTTRSAAAGSDQETKSGGSIAKTASDDRRAAAVVIGGNSGANIIRLNASSTSPIGPAALDVSNADLDGSRKKADGLEQAYRQAAVTVGPPSDYQKARENLGSHLENDYIPKLERRQDALEAQLPNAPGPTLVRAEYEDVTRELADARDLLAEVGGTSGTEANEGPSPEQREQVKTSADKIEKLLDSDGAFQWVTTGEVAEVAEEFAGLDADQANAVFDELESRGLVDDLAHEVHDKSSFPGNNNGLSDDARSAFYDDLADKLSAENLVALHDELGDTGKGELAVAIGDSDSPEMQVEFVRDLRDRTTDDRVQSSRIGFGGSTRTEYWDVDARSVAIVIGRMGDHPEHLTQAINSLGGEQLDAVLEASVGKTVSTTPASHPGAFQTQRVGTDPGVFTNIMAAVAKTDNVALKAKVFQAGAEQISFVDEQNLLLGIHSDETGRTAIVDGLTRLIDSDTTGVIGQLEKKDEFGGALAAYTQEMVSQGKTEKIREHVAKLSAGNDLSQDPKDFLEVGIPVPGKPGEFHYDNAQHAGYYVGSVVSGIDNEIKDQEARAETLKTIFGTGISAGAETTPTGVQVAAVFVELAGTEAIDAITNANLKDERQFRSTVLGLGRPDDWENSPAENAYDTAAGRVIDAN